MQGLAADGVTPNGSPVLLDVDALIDYMLLTFWSGNLDGATSAVMEMCIDNPREGFADLFATHPSVDARVRALVKFAGGHDSGRLARADDMETDMSDARATGADTATPQPGEGQPQPKRAGPWGALKPAIPFGRRDR